MEQKEKIVKLAVFKGSFVVNRLGKPQQITPQDGFLDFYESEARYLVDFLNITDKNTAKIGEDMVSQYNNDVLLEAKNDEIKALKAQLEALQANKEVATTEVKQRGRPAKSKEETAEVEKSEENQEPQA
jgi:hypothetical protein